ncbi:protein ZINC INDUCED FACILITATOR-LIKE 1-like isoform X2 [Triticum dicoccoides]|uniref:Major facilitator superfamily (MFS) profile domain-containing protein n=3 Tax=Triticum TaxID=4564 RepID=A0A3B6HX13_WHEAT|nr:protein ZINC INDUCED FACILITATOR-LIKE 1-like isoform X2 [Triticum dicoccoides]XP_044364086.1 protein ZINC INDUCED FACILITATOR-LIKE 1-like isoform X3 [Triticum aestivum]
MAAANGEEEGTSPLLSKEEERRYHPGCPGCDHDRRKELRTGLPYKEFSYVWMICLTTALPISSLFPFLYFMIRDLHVAKRTEDIGFYAGFVGASFMFGRCLTSTLWGIAADRIGRKPVVMFGILSVVIFNTLFGLSVTYWMAIAARFLLGALNGLLGPMKAYAIEVCRPEHEPLALSLVSTAWGIGLIIGPALGGYLALPAEKYPNIFSPDSLFGRFPYFLPCLCTSVFAAIVLISCIWMPETLHKHKVSDDGNQSVEALEAHLIDPKEEVGQSNISNTKKSLFKNWPLMSSIIVYCIFSFHDMAYTEVFSLWAESERKYGGLSLSSEDVGQTLAITGASLLVYQLFMYPSIIQVLGPIKSSQIAAVLCIPILFAYPYMTYLSGPGLSIVLNIASVIKNNLGVTIITGTFILQNNAVPQNQRGAANGLAMTGMSFFKAVAPAGAGIVFSWAQKRQHAFFFPGDQMVFFLLNIIELLGLVLTFRPFLAVPEQYERN